MAEWDAKVEMEFYVLHSKLFYYLHIRNDVFGFLNIY